MEGYLLVVCGFIGLLGIGAWIVEGPLGAWWRERRRESITTGYSPSEGRLRW